MHLRTDDLSAFADSHAADRYLKLIFPKPGIEYPDQIDLRAMRGTVSPENLPGVRTYTALHPNVIEGTLDIDFVVHGDEGLAGPWAATASPGDQLIANGPGGSYRPGLTAAWHLFAGDESAIPAISAALEMLPPAAVARVILLVEGAEYEPLLQLPRDAVLQFVHRSSGASLEAAVRALEWPEGRVSAFVHGEAEEVMRGIRPYLKDVRGLTREQLSISGYWRRGSTEDGYRVWKAEFARSEGP